MKRTVLVAMTILLTIVWVVSTWSMAQGPDDLTLSDPAIVPDLLIESQIATARNAFSVLSAVYIARLKLAELEPCVAPEPFKPAAYAGMTAGRAPAERCCPADICPPRSTQQAG